MIDEFLGSAKLTPRRPVVAGSCQTFTFVYTAGRVGIDDQGRLTVAFRDVCDAAKLQWDDPKAANYVSFKASSGARLEASAVGDYRPWREGITLQVLDGYIPPGGTITIVFGDRSQGSHGWRFQTFCEKTFEFRTLVDLYSVQVSVPLKRSPEVRIVPDEPARLVAIAPSVVHVGQPFTVGLRIDDKWGNPVGRVKKLKRKPFHAPGVHVLTFRDAQTKLKCESNPIVVREKKQRPHHPGPLPRRGEGLGRYWAEFHAQSEETIGTNSVEDYFAFARDKALVDIVCHQGNDIQITDTFWKRLNAVAKKMHVPGEFVTFPGYEWSGNTGVGGDRNVVYPSEGCPISRSSRALVPDEEASFRDSVTADDMFGVARKHDGLVFAHMGGRYANMDFHAQDVEIGVEVHSCWGTVEWLLADAFERGYRVGVLANSDGHKGRPGAEWPGASSFGNRGGLTCVLAEELTRESVWKALKARHFYATTGERIYLDVRTSTGATMGDVVSVPLPPGDASSSPLPLGEGRVRATAGERPGTPLTFTFRAVGTGPIERLEIRNGADVIHTWRPFGRESCGRRVKIAWEGVHFRGRERMSNWDGFVRARGGKILGFTPVGFDNPTHWIERSRRNGVRWHSIVSGGGSAVILELDRADRGILEIRTRQKNAIVRLDSLGAAGRTFKAGGVDLALRVTPLPDVHDVREVTLADWRPKHLKKGDNPIFIKLIQEDGHRAWSSPVYAVGEDRRR